MQQASPSVFYVYEHWRADKNVCFYVGKGKGDRVQVVRRKHNEHHSRVVEKLASLGLVVEVRMVATGLSETDAFALEIERIAARRAAGIELCNQTNGGDGASGAKRSSDTRAKMSARLVGRPVSEETRKKMSLSHLGQTPPNKGKTVSDEVRAKNRAASRAIMSRPEVRAKISAAHMGRPAHNKGKRHTLEARQKMSDALKGNIPHNKGVPASAISRARMSASQTRVLSSPEARARLSLAAKEAAQRPEVKARMSAAQTARRANERAAREAVCQ